MSGQTARWNTNIYVKKETMDTKCLYLRIFCIYHYTNKYVCIGLSLYIIIFF